MLVIGLSGGSKSDQLRVIEQATRFAPHLEDVRVNPFHVQCNESHDDRRVKTFRDVLVFERSGTDSLLMPMVTEVATDAEADYFRSQGGQIWHLSGPLSDTVGRDKGEPLISLHGKGRGRVTVAAAMERVVIDYLIKRGNSA